MNPYTDIKATAIVNTRPFNHQLSFPVKRSKYTVATPNIAANVSQTTNPIKSPKGSSESFFNKNTEPVICNE